MVNLSHESVRRKLATVTTEADEFPDVVVGKDGRKRPAKIKHKPNNYIIAKNLREAEEVFKACAEADLEDMPTGTVDVKRMRRVARETKAKHRRQQDYEDVKTGQFELLLGDFREKGKSIEDNSVDMIFTDPPYAKDTLPLWNDLGEYAATTLKPGGVFVSYTGVLYLPHIHEMLGRHLNYLWTAAIYHTGSNKLVSAVKIQQMWKPILIYYKPPLNKYWKPFIDMVSGGQSKEHHDWEQSVGEAAHYINALCPANGILVDPMMGSGTTLVAGLSIQKNLNCIGIEIDKAAYGTAQERISKTLATLPEKGNKDCG